jgi:hypothetical protein
VGISAGWWYSIYRYSTYLKICWSIGVVQQKAGPFVMGEGEEVLE